MSTRTDPELIELFRGGDEQGFNELVSRYQKRTYWIVRQVVSSHEDADDVVQDVFVRVHNSLKSFRGDASFYTWLYRIATNLALNALRKKRIKEFIRFEDAPDYATVSDLQADQPVLQTEYENILRRAIDLLPPKQKLVFTMRYYDALSFAEMASILRKSEGGLKANYFHALKKIQQYVRREMR